MTHFRIALPILLASLSAFAQDRPPNIVPILADSNDSDSNTSPVQPLFFSVSPAGEMPK